jgi:hypothetical protein
VRDALPHRDPTLRVAAAAMSMAQALGGAADSVRRIATFDVAVSSRDGVWLVRTTHRRTGAVHEFTGRVEGRGPSQVVRLNRAEGEHAHATEDVRPYEFPEAEARALLRTSEDEDIALLAHL